ncbi:hypothetical protein SERLA73DRAFT_188819 [Serpula lacrymans var. lacrymans S7.3]|uniref:Uncharacterized protein n=2 Tax=Serpula lacrymans var. lacrymans TaxID=341189 RepID=F8QC82_SERL3|nr:uncharacterized protein SERLADRAFT_479258 [Serpula lacrymans var. lacrymans S7.9]EGN94201.1 hypothetical protein SERLA73DRAFT_188819 [Serpula lacrymans var. lacrymans S7.3]EGO19626.1 hypothetical protein SERLADRAFT_479258 [Serpula lacrymans var. lacrymans S7.9]
MVTVRLKISHSSFMSVLAYIPRSSLQWHIEITIYSIGHISRLLLVWTSVQAPGKLFWSDRYYMSDLACGLFDPHYVSAASALVTPLWARQSSIISFGHSSCAALICEQSLSYPRTKIVVVMR